MYGTIAKMKVKPGAVKAMAKWAPEQEAEDRGAVAVYAFQMDDDSDEVYTVAIFENKDAYFANAKSPEQDARYRKMLEWLEGEPEWHDGQIVYSKQY
jgi:quinol monooxygenase YgiN